MPGEETRVVEVSEHNLRGRGESPAADFAQYLVRAVAMNGRKPLQQLTNRSVAVSDDGEMIVLEASVPDDNMYMAAGSVVIGVKFTLERDFELFPFLREGEDLQIVIRRGGETIRLILRGPISRAPDGVMGTLGSIRCAIRAYG